MPTSPGLESAPPPRRSRPAPTARSLARAAFAGACLAAVLGLEAGRLEAPRTRILVVDASRSVAAAAATTQRAVAAAAGDLAADEHLGVVLAGAEASTALPPRPAREATALLAPLLRDLGASWGTDLGGALLLAGAEAPDEVLVFSDGRDTGGRLEAAASRLARGGAVLHAVPIDAPAPRGVALTALEAPDRAPAGARVRVEATLRSPRASRAVLRATLVGPQGPTPLPTREVPLQADRPVTVAWVTPPLTAGAYWVTAAATAEHDDAPEDDLLRRPLRIGGAPAVVAVGAPLDGLAAASVAPADLAAALAEGPDLVIVSDVPAAALEAAAPALEAAVRAGAGLAVLGARRAFGPGGYGGSALEALLPVTAGPGRQRQRPLALAAAIDASGSMAEPRGASRYQAAIEVGLPLDLLRPEDAVAVVRFAEQAQEVAPLGPLAPGLIASLVGHRPRGATDVGAGLVASLQALAAAPAEADLLVVLATDSEDPDPTRHLEAIGRAAAELADGRPRPPRVLLVHVGAGRLEALRTLAAACEPAEVRVERAADSGEALRALVRGELHAQRAELRRGRFDLALTAAGAARGLVLPGAISAYAPVRLRDGVAAEPLAFVTDPGLDAAAPAAVLGRLGAGRVLAAPLELAEAGPLLGQVVGELAARAPDGVELTAVRRGRRIRVAARARPGLDLTGAAAHLLGTDGARGRLDLTPGSPEHAAGVGEAPTPRALEVVLRARGGARLATAWVPDAAGAELAEPGPDLVRLARAAEATGGRLLAAPPSAARPLPRGRPTARRALAPLLALLALGLLTLEAALPLLRARR